MSFQKPTPNYNMPSDQSSLSDSNLVTITEIQESELYNRSGMYNQSYYGGVKPPNPNPQTSNYIPQAEKPYNPQDFSKKSEAEQMYQNIMQSHNQQDPSKIINTEQP